MKKINFKKIIPGFISFVIIAGMAFQSFATNVDMAAFVKKDTYMTKYYELDWRIDEIEKTLERMYKFTCTNVISFAGTGFYYADGSPAHAQILNGGHLYYGDSWAQTLVFKNYPTIFLDDSGYLRLNKRFPLSYGGLFKAHNIVMEKEYHASQCLWHEGIVPAPNCKVKMKVIHKIKSLDGNASEFEYILGPFKKFPKYTAYGQTNGKFVVLPDCLNRTTMNQTGLQYAYGTETQPTSWTNFSTTSASLYTYGFYPTGRGDQSGWPDYTDEDIEKDAYSRKNQRMLTYIWFDNAVPQDLSSYKNLWIRWTYTTSDSSYPSSSYWGLRDMTITSWNNNK